MEVTELVSKRSTCLRRSTGAIIIKEKRILATGYNGPPQGLLHCDELGGCLRERLNIPSGERHELCRAIHAEQNAVIQAAKLGINIDGATLYVTNYPCFICAKMLINAGIKKIVYKEGYPDKWAKDILEEARIKVVKFREKK